MPKHFPLEQHEVKRVHITFTCEADATEEDILQPFANYANVNFFGVCDVIAQVPYPSNERRKTVAILITVPTSISDDQLRTDFEGDKLDWQKHLLGQDDEMILRMANIQIVKSRPVSDAEWVNLERYYCDNEVPFVDETKPMSDESYVAKGGLNCPKCGSEELKADSLEADAGIVWQNIECESCGAYRTDQYTLTGYNNFHEKDEN